MACEGPHVSHSIIFFLGHKPLRLSLSNNPQGQQILIVVRIDEQKIIAES